MRWLVLRFAEIVGRTNVYQLNPSKNNISNDLRKRLHGKYLFDCEKTYEMLNSAIAEGAKIEILPVENDQKFAVSNGQKPNPILFAMDSKNILKIATCENVIQNQKTDKILILKS